MITVDLGDGVIREMDEALLQKRTGIDEDERAKIDWVEYYLEEKLVHRSAHISLKKGIELNLETGQING